MTTEIDAEGLLPCPFCGDAEPVTTGIYGKDQWWISCAECSAKTAVFNVEGRAIAAWNRRASRSTSEAEPVAWAHYYIGYVTGTQGVELTSGRPEQRDNTVRIVPLYALPTPASDDQVEAVTDEMVKIFHEVYTSKVREYDRDFRDDTKSPGFWREKYGTHLHATSLGEKWAIRQALAAMGSPTPAPRLAATVRSGEEG